jgi:hypothetical protein
MCSYILVICDPLPGLALAVFSVYLNSDGYSEHRGGVLFSLVETHKRHLALTYFFLLRHTRYCGLFEPRLIFHR